MTSIALARCDVDDPCFNKCGSPLPERGTRTLLKSISPHGRLQIMKYRTFDWINLPGWRWAKIKQFALDGSSCSLHTEVSKAHGGSFGVVHSKISVCGNSRSRGCQRHPTGKRHPHTEDAKPSRRDNDAVVSALATSRWGARKKQTYHREEQKAFTPKPCLAALPAPRNTKADTRL